MEKSLSLTLLETSGYFAVVVLCAILGYTVSLQNNVMLWQDFAVLFLFSILVFPYLFVREYFLEKYNTEGVLIYTGSKQNLKNHGKDFPVIIFFLIVLIVGLTIFLVNPNNIETIYVSILASIVPFIFLWKNIYTSVKETNKQVYSFKHKVLIPAIFTCYIPLMFGWSLHNTDMGVSLLISLLFPTATYILLQKRNKDVIYFLYMTAVFIIAFYYFDDLGLLAHQIFPPLSYIIIITLFLGISETQKCAYDYQENPQFYQEEDGYIKNGANWSSIVFPMIMLFIPVFYEKVSVILIIILVYLQIIFWFLVSNETNKLKKSHSRISMSLGYLSLLSVILTSSISDVEFIKNIPLISPEKILLISSVLTGLFGIFITLMNKDSGSKNILNTLIDKNIWTDLFINKNFLPLGTRYILFIISFFVMILLLLIPYDEEFANNIINDRIELITNALALLLIIVSILLFRQNNRKGNKSKLSTHKNTSKREILKTNKSTSMFIHIIKTSRIETSIISGVVVFVIMFSQNGGILNSVVSALIFTLITMFGFIVNDIYDYEKDKKAGVDRPIAKNLLPKSLALWSAQIIGIVSIFISLIYDSHLAFMVVLLTMFGLTVYSHISKYIPPIKGFITSILCLSPIIYSSVSANIDISIQIYLSLFIFILGREIFMDGIDFFGDKLSNLKTIPHYIGVKTSKNIGWIMMLLGSLLYINSQHTYTTAFISILSIFILISGYIFSKKNPDKGVLASRISMLLFALILPFSI